MFDSKQDAWERAAIRAAKPMPSEDFLEGIERTLQTLPNRRSSAKRWIGPAAIAAAAVVAVLAVPPVVRAAAPFFERLFSGMARSIERDISQPTEQRIEQSIAQYEKYILRQPLAQSATVGGITITLEYVEFRPNNPEQESDKTGELRLTYSYTPVEGFNPNCVDYTVTLDGKQIPMLLTDAVKNARAANASEASKEGVCYTQNGKSYAYARFPLDDWKRDTLTDMTVQAELVRSDARGSTAGSFGALSLAFTFDPAIAHASAVAEARDALPRSDTFEKERKAFYESLAAEAVPVGIAKTAGGMRYRLEEMAFRNQALYFSSSLQGYAAINERPKLASMEAYIRVLRTDGMVAPFGTSESADFSSEGDTLWLTEGKALGRDIARLPERSLIYLEAAVGKDTIPFIFQYDWKAKRILAPESEQQETEWFAQEKALAQEKYVDPDHFAVWEPNQTQSVDGVTVTWDQVTLSNYMSLRFHCDPPLPGENVVFDFTTTVNGEPVVAPVAFTNLGYTFVLPFHPSELTDTIEVEVSFPLVMRDASGKETGRKTVSFHTVLERAAARQEDWSKK